MTDTSRSESSKRIPDAFRAATLIDALYIDPDLDARLRRVEQDWRKPFDSPKTESQPPH